MQEINSEYHISLHMYVYLCYIAIHRIVLQLSLYVFTTGILTDMWMFAILFLTSVLNLSQPTDYCITPNGHSNVTSCNNTYSLQHLLSNVEQYFISHTHFHFMTGEYFLDGDLNLNNITDIKLSGHENVTIACNSYGFIFKTIEKLDISNIHFINCSSRDGEIISGKGQPYRTFFGSRVHSKKASIILINCSSVTFKNMSIAVMTDGYAITAANILNTFHLCDITILINIHRSSNNSVMSGGIMLHFYNSLKHVPNNFLLIKNYHFSVKNSGSGDTNFIFLAIQILLLQERYNLDISVFNTTFTDMHNSLALYYYSEACRTTSKNSLLLTDIQVCNNSATRILPLFHITIHGCGFEFSNRTKRNRQQSSVIIEKSSFYNNHHIDLIISISLRKTLITLTNITIYNCSVLNNINSHFIATHSKIKSLLQLTHTVRLHSINITNNLNEKGDSLMSFSHGHVQFAGLVTVCRNHYFENIITLYFSALRVYGFVTLSHNKAYRLVNTLENSDFFFVESVKLHILSNRVRTFITKADCFDDLNFIGYYNTAKVCPAQFYSARGYLDKQLAVDPMPSISFVFSDNTVTQPNFLIKYDLGLKSNCTWLEGTAFKTTQPSRVADKLINATSVIIATKNDVYDIPSKICQCFPNNTHNCIYRDTTPIYPGQLLHLHLVVPSVDLNKKYHFTVLTLITQRTVEGCIVENVSEIFQTHPSSNCSEYHYTIKYHSYKECHLYLRTQQRDTEILFVQLKPCPPGFVLDAEACQCDPQLADIGITSCDLEHATVLRPANSWISADTDTITNSHTYLVSLKCRFNYCLPYSSHLVLSNPDSQCQFNRTGVLCGQCQHGLSNVFGSPRCKACSHYYLFIIAPVVIVTFVLIVLIFKFNLTVTNGTINNFIFYIDIVGINMERYYPNCYNIVCIFTPSHALEVCFYDGMSSYAKAWLFLCYPLYIIFIAVLLIIASRYSTKIQRLTAQRALPVLATFFMLSFTGLLRTVSFALFYYTSITHLPSHSTTLVWSVDSSIPIFGIKFVMLFIMCLTIMIILVSFNILLLLTKELLRFRIVNKIKPFLDVYLGLYNHTFSYWTGLQLVLRVAIFGFTALSWEMNLMFGALLLTVFLCLQAIVQPFKIRYYNIQHSLVLMSLVVINIISLYNRSNDMTAVKVIVFSVFGYFFVAIIGQCFLCAFNKTINKMKPVILEIFEGLKHRLSRKKSSDKFMQMDDFSSNIADVTYNYSKFQEPLIELD